MLSGSCHCGAVRFDTKTLPAHLTDCNCSICRRLGGLWAHYSPSDVVLHPAETDTYEQGDRTLAYHRCKVCGCVAYWLSTALGPGDRMAVNARLCDPAAIANLRVRRFDGADTWTFLDDD